MIVEISKTIATHSNTERIAIKETDNFSGKNTIIKIRSKEEALKLAESLLDWVRSQSNAEVPTVKSDTGLKELGEFILGNLK